MSYYHEARKAKKALKEVSVENKRRREERREAGLEDDGIEHPLNYLQVAGRACKVHRNTEQHAALERQDGLIPWNGDATNLIDRFDVRALLDFYKEPPPPRPRSAQEEKLHELLLFESFRDLVALVGKGLSEEAGLRAAHDENLAIRASRRNAPMAGLRPQAQQEAPAPAGIYSAVGFSYGTDAPPALSSSDDSDDSDDSDEDDEGGGPPVGGEQAAAEAEQDRLDSIAESYGLFNFSYRAHRALVEEGDADDAWRWKPRKRVGMKRAKARARRMAGQGLDPAGHPLNRDWREASATAAGTSKPARHHSPDGWRERDRSRSASPSGRGRASHLDLLQGLPSARPAPAIDRTAFERGEDDILDALPDQQDPAVAGTQHFPLDTALNTLRQEAAQQHLRRQGSLRHAASRSRSRSRSRSAERRRMAQRERQWAHRYGSPSRSRSRSRSRDRGRRRSRSRSRSQERERDRRWRDRAGGSSAGSTRAPASLATAASAGLTPGSGKGPATAVGAGLKSETPQERLKRIMAAQLSKQQSKDTAVATQKRIQEEKERQARDAMARQAWSPPRRPRSRSRSPDRRHRGDRY